MLMTMKNAQNRNQPGQQQTLTVFVFFFLSKRMTDIRLVHRVKRYYQIRKIIQNNAFSMDYQKAQHK